MKELSLNILDIAKNSVKAGAENIEISISEEGNLLTLSISDDGCGMSEEQVRNVMNPFFTTRTTRSVGMGIPLLKLACEQTGGEIEIISSDKIESHGTTTRATFFTDHIDFTPLGDVVSSVVALIQGSPETHWVYTHKGNGIDVSLDTDELKAVLGDVPLDNAEVLMWIRGSLEEEYGTAE